MGNQLTVGTRIYRPGRLVKAGDGVHLELETPHMKNIKDFGDGTFMLRAVPREAYLPELKPTPAATLVISMDTEPTG